MDCDVLIDSNVYIGLLRAGRDPAQAIFRRYESVDLVICGMVKLEVLRGVKLPKAKERMEAMFSLMQWVETDAKLWESATELAWGLDRRGITLPGADLIIAAAALRAGAAIHTFDRHFLTIPGLAVIQAPL